MSNNENLTKSNNGPAVTTDKKTLGKSIMWNTVGSVYYAMCQWVMTVYAGSGNPTSPIAR